MTRPREIIGELYFSDHEPRIIGHLEIGGVHYEIVGIRRSHTRADIKAHRIGRGSLQPDLPLEQPSCMESE